MYHTAQEEDQEVHPGDEGVRSEEGVDKAQEQEGVDGLHVVPVGSEKAKGCSQPGVSFENILGAGTLCPQRPCAPGVHLWHTRLTSIAAGQGGNPEAEGDRDSKLVPASSSGSEALLMAWEPRRAATWVLLPSPRARQDPAPAMVSPILPSGLGHQQGKVGLSGVA